MQKNGAYVANFTKNFPNSVILSVSEVSQQKDFQTIVLRMTGFYSINEICCINPEKLTCAFLLFVI